MIRNHQLKILFVEDVPSDVDLAVLELRKEKLHFEYTTVCTRIDLEKALDNFGPDLIISDYMMPSFNGLDALRIAKKFNPEIPFILYTGSVNEETAVECIKEGAQDYVIKEHLTRLPFAVKEALEQLRVYKEKKASELLLRENEEKLQSIFRAAPVGIGLMVNRVLIELNDALCEMTGYDRNELIGKSSEILYSSTEEFITVGKEKYQQILETGKGMVETKFKCKDGSLLNVIISTTPLDKNDNSKGITFIVLNITERKKSEEALRKSEVKYRRIFENVQDVYYETTIDGKILEVSPSIEVLTGYRYKMDDLTGKSMYDFYSDPREREQITKELEEKGFVTDFEVTLTNRDGSKLPCSVSAKLLYDPDGNIEKIIGSIRNITDRKNASDALRLAKEKAEMSDRLKTDFLNNISHEVRTPLNGILGFAEIISLHDLTEEEKKDSLGMLFESSNRLLNTITNYMDISLITSGSLTVIKKEFRPSEILKSIYDNFISACQNRKLELFLDLPEQPEKYFIKSDPEICRKIVTHLMDNAVKFTDRGRIHLGFIMKDGELEFFVKDTGIGIKQDSLNAIFERFVKEYHGQFRPSEGSGLGLSIARGMADAIGGKINLESEYGSGSVFFLSIPVEKEKELQMKATPADSGKATTAGTILVAEDDETNFYYLNALLNRETNSKVLHAINGREAIEIYKDNPDIKLILMDMKMPVIDGFEATKQIKLLNSSLPIIAVTAYAMSGDEERIMASGCDGYLSKPISKKSLMDKITEYIKV